jgi:hypothetical protein
MTAGHHTLAPNMDNIPGTYIVKTNMSYAYYEPWLQCGGWKPHCILFLCIAEPKDYRSNFDRTYWNACRVIFNDMAYLVEFHEYIAVWFPYWTSLKQVITHYWKESLVVQSYNRLALNQSVLSIDQILPFVDDFHMIVLISKSYVVQSFKF